MLFNSLSFLLFLPTVWLLAWALRGRLAWRNGGLLGASYVFYGAWDWRYLGLLLLSTGLGYVCAQRIEAAGDNEARRRAWLGLCVGVNLGILGFFKYWDFGVAAMDSLLARLGLSCPLPVLHVALPIGISFYCFQTLSYALDVAGRRQAASRRFTDFALYVSFFPQLVAGPIERSTDLMPQLERPFVVGREEFRRGLLWLLQGYFLKCIVADTLAPYVDEAYQDPHRLGGDVLLLATGAFALQVFGDFAGYTLIARGCAQWFGIRLVENFRRPYLARDPADFWRRWHTSLSEWFRHYLFTPLALWSARRHGRWLSSRLPIFLTFVLIGLWHGAGWNFIAFGLFWASWLVAYESWRRRRPGTWTTHRGYQALAWLCTAAGTLVSFVLFRSHDLGQATVILARVSDLSTWNLGHPAGTYLRLVAVAGLPVFALMLWEEHRGGATALLSVPRWLRWALYAAVLLVLAVVGFRPTPFIYFQF